MKKILIALLLGLLPASALAAQRTGQDPTKLPLAGGTVTGKLTAAGGLTAPCITLNCILGPLYLDGTVPSATFTSSVTVAGTNSLNVGGNVGIGTASPAFTLDVNGSAGFGSGVTKSTFSATGTLTLDPGASIVGTSLQPTTNTCTTATTCTATCPAGTRVTGGGCFGTTIADSYAPTSTSWQCDTAVAATFTAEVICAKFFK